VLLWQAGQVRADFWTKPTSLDGVPYLACQMIAQPEDLSLIGPWRSALAIACAALLIVPSLALALRRPGAAEWYTLGAVLIPCALIGLCALGGIHLLIARYLAFAHLFALTALALASRRLTGARRLRVAAYVLVLFAGLALHLVAVSDYRALPGARGAAAWIASQRRADEPLVCPPHYFLAVVHHLGAEQRHGCFLFDEAGRVKHYMGSAALKDGEAVSSDWLARLSADRVWVVDMQDGAGCFADRTIAMPGGWVPVSQRSFTEAFHFQGTLVVTAYARTTLSPVGDTGGRAR
jgi:hypothetical protein